MAILNTIKGGSADYLKEFIRLVCPSSRQEAPHTQRRLLAHWPGHYKGEYQILVQCGTCKLEYVWYTNDIPADLQPFKIRVHASATAHPLRPDELLPEMEEEFIVLAADRQSAYRQAQFSQTMPTAGQLVTTYIDEEEERDARF
jgi:hypothetical protein